MAKVCGQCKVEKPDSEFNKKTGARDGLQAKCIPCLKEVHRLDYIRNREARLATNKRWRDANKGRVLENRLRASFNIDPLTYAKMLVGQDGKCYFCQKVETTKHSAGSTWSLSVDHDHACCPQSGKSCGKCIRWLLCNNCNLIIGMLNDDATLLRRMADEIDKWRSAHPKEPSCTES